MEWLGRLASPNTSVYTIKLLIHMQVVNTKSHGADRGVSYWRRTKGIHGLPALHARSLTAFVNRVCHSLYLISQKQLHVSVCNLVLINPINVTSYFNLFCLMALDDSASFFTLRLVSPFHHHHLSYPPRRATYCSFSNIMYSLTGPIHFSRCCSSDHVDIGCTWRVIVSILASFLKKYLLLDPSGFLDRWFN